MVRFKIISSTKEINRDAVFFEGVSVKEEVGGGSRFFDAIDKLIDKLGFEKPHIIYLPDVMLEGTSKLLWFTDISEEIGQLIENIKNRVRDFEIRTPKTICLPDIILEGEEQVLKVSDISDGISEEIDKLVENIKTHVHDFEMDGSFSELGDRFVSSFTKLVTPKDLLESEKAFFSRSDVAIFEGTVVGVGLATSQVACLNPLDVIKARLQTVGVNGEVPKTYLHALFNMSSLPGKENLKSKQSVFNEIKGNYGNWRGAFKAIQPYSGSGMSLLARLPYFAIMNATQRFTENAVGADPNREKTPLLTLLSSCVSGGVAAAALSVIEVPKVKVQLDPTFKTVPFIKKHGLMSLWDKEIFKATASREIFFTAGLYGSPIVASFLESHVTPNHPSLEGKEKLIASVGVGTICGMLTNPMDVAKTRLQSMLRDYSFNSLDVSEKTFSGCLKKEYGKNGLSFFVNRAARARGFFVASSISVLSYTQDYIRPAVKNGILGFSGAHE